MSSIIGLIILAFIIVWASRVENGVNRTNEALKRIEDELKQQKKKEKK